MDAFWRDRRVLVTGCTGLVGSWTTRLLVEQGAHVVGLIRDRVAGSELYHSGTAERIDVVRGAVEDDQLIERTLAEYEVQTIFHLAARTIVGVANRSPLSTFDSNIRGTYSVLEAARRCGSRPQVIVASSDKAYGEHEQLPYTEDAPLKARHPYDVSKACADMLALTYAHTYGLAVCVTRCGNFFGPGDLNFNRLVPGTVRSVLRGERPVIRSDGGYVRDYFYVKDGALAYLHLAQCLARRPDLAGRAYNFSNEIQVTVLDLVRRLLKLMRSPLEPDVQNTATNEIRHQYLSAARARTELSWRPRYTLDESLAETV